ncbi:MAG: sigma-70 family RNA polymerase sigma factor [Mycobacteriaceae bacterium]
MPQVESRLEAGVVPGEQALVEAARLGDRGAFEEIVRRNGASMYRYARRMLRDSGDAQEAVQDAFVAAWQGLESYQGRSSLTTWLLRLTVHKSIDLARRSRASPVDDRMLSTVAAGPASDPLVHATQGELLAELELALAELPYRQRACWVLVEVDGLSPSEVGEVVGLSPGAVRGQLHRARSNLERRMQRWR